MNLSNEILNEIATLSPLLAGMEKINVFSVPDDYFNTLAETIVESMQEPSRTSIHKLSKNNLPEVPESYFENLSDIILNKVKQQAANPDEELKDLSPAFYGINKNIFEAPAGYFEGLSDAILNKVKYQLINTEAELNSLSSTLYSIKDKNVFEIPEGYFEDLPDTILSNIKQQAANAEEEIKVLSPVLYGIKNKNVFEVPAGYFNTTEASMLSKVKPQPAKVVVMHKRTSFFKYASAAMVACIAMLGVYKFVNKSGGNHTTATTLTFASLDPAIQTGIKMNDNQFDQALNNLSDDEIASYLDKNGNYADVPALSSSIDENNLPDAEQYLIDDKTLDNYLKDNDLQESKK